MIFPETIAGGLLIRDIDGNPVVQATVQNAYVPAPVFVSSCAITALPSDCTARVEPRQINNIVSELVAFAECLDPDGPWNCTSLQNLCNAFQTWATNNISIPSVFDGVTITGAGTSADPYHVGTLDCGTY